MIFPFQGAFLLKKYENGLNRAKYYGKNSIKDTLLSKYGVEHSS